MYYRPNNILITISIIFGLTISGNALAQGSSTAATQTTEPQSTGLVTTVPITEQDLGVPTPSRWEFIKRRVARLVTFSQVKKLRLDNERAKLLLVQARVELRQGNTGKATELINQYNQTMTRVVQETTALAGQVSTSGNTQAQTLISEITEQKILEASTLDALSLATTGEFNRKVTDAKLKALKDLAKLLEKENLSEEKLHEKLDKISEKLEKKTTKVEEKFAKRLKLAEELDKVAEVPELQDALDEQHDETLDEIAKKHKDNLGNIVKEIEGNVTKHVAVLEELLQRVPVEAKPAVQEAINRSQERLTKQLEKVRDNQREIEEKIDEAVGEVKERKAEAQKKTLEVRQKAEEAQKKALERLKERVNGHEQLKREIEKRKQKLDDEMEKRTKEEEKKEQEKQSANSSQTSGSSGTTESKQPEPKTYEIQYKDGRFDTSDVPTSINVNDSIKFKNEDDEVVDIESNPHPIHTSFTSLNIGRLAKGEEKTVKFTQAGTIGFHNHLIPSVTGSVVVK